MICSRPDAQRQQALQRAGALIEVIAERRGRPDPVVLMTRLAELECNELLVEAGPLVNGALLDAGLVDEVVVYLAPHVLGADARGMFASRPLAGMAARHEFELTDVRRIGPDCRLTYCKRSG